MKKVKVLAIVSAVITALLLFVFLNSLKSAGNSETSVITAAVDIPANTLITSSMVTISNLSAAAVVAGALTDESQVIGKISQDNIFTGEQLLSGRLVSTGDISNSKTLAYAIKSGMRAISIDVDQTSGLAYMITPGNNIDIIAQFVSPTSGDGAGKTTYTTMILENIIVLAVDNVFSKEGKINSEQPAYATLTLQVTPKQAMEVSMARLEGKLTVILRSPTDKKVTGQPSITLGAIMVK